MDPMNELRDEWRARDSRSWLVSYLTYRGLATVYAIAFAIWQRDLLFAGLALATCAFDVPPAIWLSRRRRTGLVDAHELDAKPVAYRGAVVVTELPAKRSSDWVVFCAVASLVVWVIWEGYVALRRGDLDTRIASLLVVSVMAGGGWVMNRVYQAWRKRRNARLELELERKIGLLP